MKNEYTRHGGAYDRGVCDSYYRRPHNPHYFKGPTYGSEEVTEDQMTEEEIAAYSKGYNDNEEMGDFKEYG